MQAPKDKLGLQRFLGMCTYLGRFLKNLSSESKSLRQLIQNKSEWKWSEQEDQEFQKLKDMVLNAKTQKYYDLNKPVIVECDSSSTGLGAVMYQNNEVLAMASRVLTKSERNYAMIEKELL